MKSEKLVTIFLILFIVLLFSSCVPGGGSSTADDPAGFFLGIWHGWIAPLSLILGVFDPSIRVYEQFNTGWLYDFGFYIAIIGGFGSISLIRKKHIERKR
jgi:hypothetical protein